MAQTIRRISRCCTTRPARWDKPDAAAIADVRLQLQFVTEAARPEAAGQSKSLRPKSRFYTTLGQTRLPSLGSGRQAVYFSLSHKAVWRAGWESWNADAGCEIAVLGVLKSWLLGVGP